MSPSRKVLRAERHAAVVHAARYDLDTRRQAESGGNLGPHFANHFGRAHNLGEQRAFETRRRENGIGIIACPQVVGAQTRCVGGIGGDTPGKHEVHVILGADNDVGGGKGFRAMSSEPQNLEQRIERRRKPFPVVRYHSSDGKSLKKSLASRSALPSDQMGTVSCKTVPSRLIGTQPKLCPDKLMAVISRASTSGWDRACVRFPRPNATNPMASARATKPQDNRLDRRQRSRRRDCHRDDESRLGAASAEIASDDELSGYHFSFVPTIDAQGRV